MTRTRGYRESTRYVVIPCDRAAGTSQRHRWDDYGHCINCGESYRDVTETARKNRGPGPRRRRKADNAKRVITGSGPSIEYRQERAMLTVERAVARANALGLALRVVDGGSDE